MKNQFIYTRRVPKPVKVEGQEQEFDEVRDSLNINKVIRTVTMPDETLVILLDDFNERVTQEPDIDPKTNKFKGYKNVRQTVQSEITLTEKGDIERFFKLTNIE